MLQSDGVIGPVHVAGALYPPTFQAQVIAQIAGALWLAGLALVFAGPQIFRMLGIEEPEYYRQIKEKQMLFLGGLFMLNNLGNSMLATGAFEIHLEDELVFSKLDLNRPPTQHDLDYLVSLLVQRGE